MLLSVKLKNQLKKLNPDVECHLKNIIINGQKRGCSGFVQLGDSIVYTNTERYNPNFDRLLYRKAKHLKDSTGGYNHFTTERDLAKQIIYLLTHEDFIND